MDFRPHMQKANLQRIIYKKRFFYAYDRRNLGDDLFANHFAGRYPNRKTYCFGLTVVKSSYKIISPFGG